MCWLFAKRQSCAGHDHVTARDREANILRQSVSNVSVFDARRFIFCVRFGSVAFEYDLSITYVQLNKHKQMWNYICGSIHFRHLVELTYVYLFIYILFKYLFECICLFSLYSTNAWESRSLRNYINNNISPVSNPTNFCKRFWVIKASMLRIAHTNQKFADSRCVVLHMIMFVCVQCECGVYVNFYMHRVEKYMHIVSQVIPYRLMCVLVRFLLKFGNDKNRMQHHQSRDE